MTILITGITGFLGSHLAKALVDSGYKIHGLIRKESSLKRLEGYLEKLKFHYIEDGIEQAFNTEAPHKAVIHTATCYGRKGESQLEILNANLSFPLDLLEKAALFKTDIFLNTDTILYKYLNGYALSKCQFAEWGQQFANQNKIRFCNIKLEHMYGPGDDDTKFSTYIIRNCLTNAPEIKLTPGEQKRDFIYIDDVISAYQILLESNTLPNFSEFELGSGIAITIREFVETVHQITQSKSHLDFTALPYRDNEIMESRSNISALSALGWSPRVDLVSGLKKMIGEEK